MVIEEREFLVDIDAFHQSNVGNIAGLNNAVTCLLTSDSGVALMGLVGGYTSIVRPHLVEF
jgi:hypothetical protein